MTIGPVRFVAGVGATLPRLVGRLIGSPAHPSDGAATLAYA